MEGALACGAGRRYCAHHFDITRENPSTCPHNVESLRKRAPYKVNLHPRVSVCQPLTWEKIIFVESPDLCNRSPEYYLLCTKYPVHILLCGGRRFICGCTVTCVMTDVAVYNFGSVQQVAVPLCVTRTSPAPPHESTGQQHKGGCKVEPTAASVYRVHRWRERERDRDRETERQKEREREREREGESERARERERGAYG